MKKISRIILANWCLSMMGATVDTDHTAMWVCLLLLGWFLASTALLNTAHRRGWMKSIMELRESRKDFFTRRTQRDIHAESAEVAGQARNDEYAEGVERIQVNA